MKIRLQNRRSYFCVFQGKEGKQEASAGGVQNINEPLPSRAIRASRWPRACLRLPVKRELKTPVLQADENRLYCNKIFKCADKHVVFYFYYDSKEKR